MSLCTLSADKRTLTRNTVRDSSNAGAMVSFGAGTKRVTVVNDGMSIENPLGTYVSEKAFEAHFTGYVADQKIRFDWPAATRLQGRVEITCATGYDGANAVGYIKKTYGLYLHETNGSAYTQEVNSEGTYPCTLNLRLSNFLWDSTKLCWYVVVASASGNQVSVTIKTYAATHDNPAWTNMSASKVVMSALYIDPTVYPAISPGLTVTGGINGNGATSISTTNRNPGVYVYKGNADYGMELGYSGGVYAGRIFVAQGQGQVVTIGSITDGGTTQANFTDWAKFGATGLDVLVGTIKQNGVAVGTVTDLAGKVSKTGDTMTGALGFTNGTEVPTIQGVDGWGLISNVPAGRAHRQRVNGFDTAVLGEAGLTINSATSNTLLDLSPPDAFYSNIKMRGRYGNASYGLDILAGQQQVSFSADAFTFRNAAQNNNYATLDVNALAVNLATTTFGKSVGVAADCYLSLRNTNYYNNFYFKSYLPDGSGESMDGYILSIRTGAMRYWAKGSSAFFINDVQKGYWDATGLHLNDTSKLVLENNAAWYGSDQVGTINFSNTIGVPAYIRGFKPVGAGDAGIIDLEFWPTQHSGTAVKVLTLTANAVNIEAGKALNIGGAPVAMTSQLANYLPLTGGTLTNNLTIDNAGAPSKLTVQGITANQSLTLQQEETGITSVIAGTESFGISFKALYGGATGFKFHPNSSWVNPSAVINGTGMTLGPASGAGAFGADAVLDMQSTNFYTNITFSSSGGNPAGAMVRRGEIWGAGGSFRWDNLYIQSLDASKTYMNIGSAWNGVEVLGNLVVKGYGANSNCVMSLNPTGTATHSYFLLAGQISNAQALGLYIIAGAGTATYSCNTHYFQDAAQTNTFATINATGIALPGGRTITIGGVAVASTSQLASYLPLTGGTLTGAFGARGVASNSANAADTSGRNPGLSVHGVQYGVELGYSGGTYATRVHTDNAQAVVISMANVGNATLQSHFTDMARFDGTGLTMGSGKLIRTLDAPIRSQSNTGGTGWVDLVAGTAANTGYVSFYNGAGTRLGYVGNAGTDDLYLSAEAGRHIYLGGASVKSNGNFYAQGNRRCYQQGSPGIGAGAEIFMATAAPAAGDGNNGDIWLQYA